jgi:hypothetical protein
MTNKLKLRIPKRVAGVKIPKTVRKGPVAKFLNSSAGQVLLAEALVVVGGTLAAERSGSGSGLGELVRNRASGAWKGDDGVDIGPEANRLASALNEAIRAFRTRLLSEERQSTRDGDMEDAGDVQSESLRPKKKTAGSPTETPSMQH